jgi:hypothetical protein
MARGRSEFRTRDRIRIRRILQGIGPQAEQEILQAYQQRAPAILAYARGEIPSRSGKLRAAMSFKIFPKTLRLRIGLLTKRIQSKFFYAHILEGGRRAQVARVRRQRPVSGGISVYTMRVRAISRDRYDFVRGRAEQFMQRTLGDEMRGVLSKALNRLSAGG